MQPLFQCQACGFLSTLGSQFNRVEGVLLDRGCERAYRQRRQPVTEWVEQAKLESLLPR